MALLRALCWALIFILRIRVKLPTFRAKAFREIVWKNMFYFSQRPSFDISMSPLSSVGSSHGLQVYCCISIKGDFKGGSRGGLWPLSGNLSPLLGDH